MGEAKAVMQEGDYCEESQLLVREYGRSAGVAFEGEVEFVERWLCEEGSAPLLVVGEAGSGKKTLLCELLRRSREAHPQWLHLAHFAAATPHYAHILYRTMVALRDHFNVHQRVDLNEEKLRRYFKYWLEVASELIEKQHLGYARAEVPKVVIVIEGIDDCVDGRGAPVDPDFWLPQQIPRNVRLILTTKAATHADPTAAHAYPADAALLRHYLTHDQRQQIASSYEEQVRALARGGGFSLYELQVANCMARMKPNFSFGQLPCFLEVLREYIGGVCAGGLSGEEVRSLLYMLTLTRKGLTARAIQKTVSITPEKWGQFLRFFSFFIVEDRGHFIICNKSARAVIRELVDRHSQKQRTYRLSICQALRNEAVRLRQLEEVVQQLYQSECFPELKEVISRVQNFAMLYTPLSKDLLCQSWVKLEQLEQYDPVFEYNKAIEAYKSHYYPKEEDLFKIIFQISMFFKEYAEFENARTPEFRHPLIKGETDQLVEIGIHEELKSLAMIGRSKVYKLKPLEKFTSLPKKTESAQETKKEAIEATQTTLGEKGVKGKGRPMERKTVSKARQSDISVVEPSRPETSSSKDEEAQPQAEPLNIEQLNVSIQANQEKFRSFFTTSMKDYLENYFAPLKKCAVKEKELSFESEESENEEESGKDRMGQVRLVEVQKLKESLLLKKFREYLQESYHKTGEEVRYYYYKQWIWLQFPWICQTVRNVYSQMIKECLPGSIHFMSPSQEYKFVREVLKIARTAKESKMSIFTEKRIEVLPLKCSPEKGEGLEALRKSKAEDEVKASRTRRVPNDPDQPKFTINLATIDEIINSEKQFEQNHREKFKELTRGGKGQSSSPNLNMFVTETVEKSSRLLPCVSKSKFAKQARCSNREKQNHEGTKDYTMVIRKYNELKHENEMLVQKIQEMRRLSSLQLTKSREEHDALIFHIRNVEEKKEILEKNFNHQSLLQKKLEVIIKICDLNKMYGSESEYLSAYLNSLKQMIHLEEYRVKDVRARITELIDNGKGEIKQLRRKRKELKTIKEDHDRMYINLGTNSTNQYKAMPLEEIEEELKEFERSVKTKSKKEKTKIDRCLSTQDYELLEETFGLVFGERGNEDKLKSFSDKSEKKKELSLKNSELRQCIKREQSLLQALREKATNLQQVSLNEKGLATSNELLESKKALAQLRQRSHVLEDALASLRKQ